MEKVIVSAKTRKQVRKKLNARESAQREAEEKAFIPRVDEPTIEEVLIGAGVMTAQQIEDIRGKMRNERVNERMGRRK